MSADHRKPAEPDQAPAVDHHAAHHVAATATPSPPEQPTSPPPARRPAGPEPVEGPRHLPARRWHRAARRVDRQRRPAVDLGRTARRDPRGRAVDPVRLRPVVRAAARARRPTRRRLGSTTDVRDRRRAVHGRQRPVRVRAERARPGHRAPGAGTGGRSADPAGHRAHPAAVPRQGARHRVRAVRRDRRHRDRDRSAHRRAADHRLRHRERVAVRVLREPARRTRDDPPGLPVPARRREGGARQAP